MRAFLIDCYMFFLNHIIRHVPFYCIRRLFYTIAGMKIGKTSRILMGVYIQNPKGITIGEHCYINEFCMLDGRGGLTIKDNVSLSMYTKTLTATHDSNSSKFDYVEEPIVLEENVWTGIGSIILPGTRLPKGVIIAAGSVAIKNTIYEEKNVYSGVPAKKIGVRKYKDLYQLPDWKPRFR